MIKKINHSPLRKLVIILGPTASGKTALAIKLAKKFNGEIISADSRQIYRGMDVGTAKPFPNSKFKIQNAKLKLKIKNEQTLKPKIIECIPHFLIDIKYPDENYTVAEFKDEAVKIIKNIQLRGKIPFLCGGTGLYIETIVKNLDIPRVPPNPRLRKKLEKGLKTKGIGFLYQKLVKLDPEAAYIIDPQNSRRIIRALEVMMATKIPFSAQRKTGKPLFKILQIGLLSGKEKLRKRINERADEMIKNGFVREVKKLKKKYPWGPAAFDAIGYREIIQYLNKKISPGEAVDLIKKNTWRFARRQMSWFRRDKSIKWISDWRKAEKLIGGFLKK